MLLTPPNNHRFHRSIRPRSIRVHGHLLDGLLQQRYQHVRVDRVAHGHTRVSPTEPMGQIVEVPETRDSSTSRFDYHEVRRPVHRGTVHEQLK